MKCIILAPNFPLRKKLRFITPILVSLILYPFSALSQPSFDKFKLTIQLDKQMYHEDDAIEITCVVTNISQQAQKFIFEENSLKANFKNLDGQKISLAPGDKGFSASHYIDVREINLNPNEEFKHVMHGKIKKGIFDVVAEDKSSTAKAEGLNIEFGQRMHIYKNINKLEIGVDYDFYQAMEYRAQFRPDLSEFKNPNFETTKVENKGNGLTVTDGHIVANPKMLKSNTVVLNIDHRRNQP